MQLYKQFDPETVAKIKSSAIIGVVGFLVAVLPMVQEDVLMMAKDKPYLVSLITVLGSVGYNALLKWYQGVKPEDK